jgi:hypothetical protein
MNSRELRQFIAYVASFGFERMQCIVYLRDYITYWESELQQKIKAGLYIDLTMEEQELAVVRTYQKFLESLSGCFNRDAICVRLFHRPLLKDGDVVADFLKVANINVIKSSGVFVNESLSRTAMIALNELNKRVPRRASSGRLHDNATKVLQSIGGPKYGASPAVARRILDCTKEDREYVAQHWFSRRDWFLETMEEVIDTRIRSHPGGDHPSSFDEIMDAVGLLYANMQRVAAEHGAERWRVVARLAQERGQNQRAQKALENHRIMLAHLRAADPAWVSDCDLGDDLDDAPSGRSAREFRSRLRRKTN